MARRKRLLVPNAPVTKDAQQDEAMGGLQRVPISQIAGETAAYSALDALTREIQDVRQEGRLIQSLPLEVVEADHQVRDRIVIDDEDMAALKRSIAARGQQTPIDVVEIGNGRYGLISGYRRLVALRELLAENGGAEFATVRALVRADRDVRQGYVAMVEENEIRANLTFYERAHLACEAARLEIFESSENAVRTLFAAASPAKRSKILAFVRLHDAIGDALKFPTAIPERLGLALATALDDDGGLARRLRDRLLKQPADSVETERAVLERAVKKVGSKADRGGSEVAPGIRLEPGRERLVLRGPGVTGALIEELKAWLARQ